MTGLLLTQTYIAMMERLEEINRAIPKSVHTNPVRIDDEGYLWEITYESFDKRSADFHFAPISFGCSGVQKGKLRGRNFDWFYGFDTTWVVHTKKGGDRTREVTGIAFLGGVTNRMMIDGYRGEGLEYLPYRMVDGINDMGLMIQTNVAPPNEAWGRTTGTNPGKPLLFALEFCQYALERCSTVAEVMAMLDNVNFIAAYGKLTEEFHYLVRDRQGVEGVIEFVGNAPVFVEGTGDEPPIMTNFNIAEYRKGNYGLHPAGLERYAILKGRYSGIGTASDMMETMRAVRYTLSFEGEPTDEGAWLSESLGNWGQHGGELNWENTNHLENKEMFVEPYRYMKWLIANDPVGKTWRTVHTSVYDMENGVMSVALHENYDKIYTFDIPKDDSVALPPFTLRFKARRVVSISDFRDTLPITLTLVDDATHTYDVTLEQEDWSYLFYPIPSEEENNWLTEVVAANTSGVTKMRDMFGCCTLITSVPLFDTSSVMDMTDMFSDCINLRSVPLFDTRSVMAMNGTFGDCHTLTSVPLFDTSNVTDMRGMFYWCPSLTSVPLFDTSNVTDMRDMFDTCLKVESGALALYTQASTQANPPTLYSDAFRNCGADTVAGLAELQQIPTSWGGEAYPPYTLRFRANRAVSTSDFGTPVTLTLVDNVRNIYDLYYDNANWNGLFSGRSFLTTIIAANLDGVTSMEGTFSGCSWLTSVSLLDTSSVTSMNYTFSECSRLTSVSLPDMPSVTSMEGTFRGCSKLTSVSLLDMSSVTSMEGTFYGCISLTSVPLFDTASVTRMEGTFSGCTSLTSVPLFDTSSVTSMGSMFSGCTSLTSVPLFDTSSVTSMDSMFYGCRKVEHGALALYTQASTQANPPSSHSGTFTDCGIDTETGLAELQQIPTSWGGKGLPPYTLRFKASRAVTLSDFSGRPVTLTLVDDATHTYDLTYENEKWSGMFDVYEIDNSWLIEVVDANLPSVTSLRDAFRQAENLVRVNMTDTSSVTDMSYAFSECYSLESVTLSDMSSVTDMVYTFSECYSLESVTLSGTSSLANMSHTFNKCTSLVSVPLFDTSSVTDMSGAFVNCRKVESGALALYTQASTQANPPSSYSYAFVDCGVDTESGLAELQQIPTSWGGLAE